MPRPQHLAPKIKARRRYITTPTLARAFSSPRQFCHERHEQDYVPRHGDLYEGGAGRCSEWSHGLPAPHNDLHWDPHSRQRRPLLLVFAHLADPGLRAQRDRHRARFRVWRPDYQLSRA